MQRKKARIDRIQSLAKGTPKYFQSALLCLTKGTGSALKKGLPSLCLASSFFSANLAQGSPLLASAVLPIPAPLEAPASPAFLELLLLLSFFAHLLLINLLLGSLLLALLDPHAGTGAQSAQDALSAKKNSVSGNSLDMLPKILALAVNFGIAPFLFLQVLYGNFLYPAIVIMAVWWLSIVLFVMLAYYGLYISGAATSPWRTPVLALATALLLGVAFLMTCTNTFMIRPEQWPLWLDRPNGTVLDLSSPSLFPRYLHILMASLAVGGLGMSWKAHLQQGADEKQSRKIAQRGLSWFFYASLAQIPVGAWFLLSLSPSVRARFLGEDPLATCLLALALMALGLALYLAHKKNLKAVSLVTGCVILLMVCLRALLRHAMLEPYLLLSSASVSHQALAMPHGQDAALAFFIGFVALAGLILIWMYRMLKEQNRQEQGNQEQPALKTVPPVSKSYTKQWGAHHSAPQSHED